MNLILRLIRVFVMALFRSRIKVLDESRLGFRVWPNDLDLNLHMNNGRYLTVMDLGRLDLAARLGLFRRMAGHGWRPVTRTATIHFRNSLLPFQKYRLVTRLVCWDDKWTYLEQRFEAKGEVVALAYIKLLFRAGRRTLRTREVLRALDQEQRSPHMPPVLEALRLAEGLSGEKPGRA